VQAVLDVLAARVDPGGLLEDVAGHALQHALQSEDLGQREEQPPHEALDVLGGVELVGSRRQAAPEVEVHDDGPDVAVPLDDVQALARLQGSLVLVHELLEAGGGDVEASAGQRRVGRVDARRDAEGRPGPRLERHLGHGAHFHLLGVRYEGTEGLCA
jgi:hypothetical protein